jgi:hypothetical protein
MEVRAGQHSLDRHGPARLAMTSLRGGEADAAIQYPSKWIATPLRGSR